MNRLALLALALVLPPLAMAQDRDTQEINRYVLTEAGLARYTQATQQLSKLEVHSDCDDDDDSNDNSIDAVVARLDAKPAAKAAVQSAGLTSREYVVFGMAMFQSGMTAWALDQPGGKLPPGVSMANVSFYRKHAAEIERLSVSSKASGCGTEGEESDAGESG